MRRRLLRSKLHRIRLDRTDVDYEGSITLPAHLLRAADICEFEQVAVLDVDNGARFETYAITGADDLVCVNGAAAHLVQPGDLLIVMSFGDFDENEVPGHRPRVVLVDHHNQVASPIEQGPIEQGS